MTDGAKINSKGSLKKRSETFDKKNMSSKSNWRICYCYCVFAFTGHHRLHVLFLKQSNICLNLRIGL